MRGIKGVNSRFETFWIKIRESVEIEVGGPYTQSLIPKCPWRQLIRFNSGEENSVMSAQRKGGRTQPESGDEDGPQKRRVLNVDDATHEVIHKIAALRRLRKVELVFQERDVREFFLHLLKREVDREKHRLEDK